MFAGNVFGREIDTEGSLRFFGNRKSLLQNPRRNDTAQLGLFGRLDKEERCNRFMFADTQTGQCLVFERLSASQIDNGLEKRNHGIL